MNGGNNPPAKFVGVGVQYGAVSLVHNREQGPRNRRSGRIDYQSADLPGRQGAKVYRRSRRQRLFRNRGVLRAHPSFRTSTVKLARPDAYSPWTWIS